MKTFIALLIVMVASPSVGLSQTNQTTVTPLMLAEFCEATRGSAQDDADLQFCYGYLIGFVTAIAPVTSSFCVPSDVTAEQLRRVFLASPATPNGPLRAHLIRVLIQSFPCG